MKDNAREDKVEEARDQVEGRRRGRRGRCGESECRGGLTQPLEPQVQSDSVISAPPSSFFFIAVFYSISPPISLTPILPYSGLAPVK